MDKVSDVMTRDVETVEVTTTIGEAARLMRDRHVGALPVDVGETLAGLVTDRDIAVRAMPEALALSKKGRKSWWRGE